MKHDSRPVYLLRLAIALIPAIFWGCQSHAPGDARVPVDNVYEVDDELPSHIQRVALLPVYWEGYQPYTDDYVDEVVAQALRESTRFEVVTIPREIMRDWYGDTQINSQTRLPRDLPQRILDDYGATGLMLVDLNHFRPYPPMEVSMKAQLVDISTGETVWTVDHTETAGNPALQEAAEKTEADNLDAPVEAFAQRASYSPRRFLAVVSQSLFHTLPKRH
ncbi:MAG: hypothetical protein E1N59_137 [Puniceicoccaceae bacterium 5H]|nr:MAG: hypothetical protein E1N59_137 [Puniceicoccaceae bacterium 5H]